MSESLFNMVADFWSVLGDMAPYLLFGFATAGVLSVALPPKKVERHFGGPGIWPVIRASLFGVPLPLCSCGVIPVFASLRKHGASRAATTAFLISTPQTGLDSVLVTFSLLGGVFAVFRPLAALVSGIVGGAAVLLFGPAERVPLTPSGAGPSGGGSTEESGGWIRRAARFGFVTLPRDIGRSLLVGLVIAGVISALVPDDYFSGLVGGRIGTIVVMMLVGIPVYVCATASVPIAAALIAKGISPGAALAFLITGPATNMATLSTVWKVLGRRTAMIYVSVVALTALLSGLLLDLTYSMVVSASHIHNHPMLPGYVNMICALILLVIVGAAMLPTTIRSTATPVNATDAADTLRLSVEGMTCRHCAETVRSAIMKCSGVTSAEVDLNRKEAIATGSALEAVTLRRAVEQVGFTVQEVRTV